MPLPLRPQPRATHRHTPTAPRQGWRLTALACSALIAMATQAQPVPTAAPQGAAVAPVALDLPAAPLAQSLNALAQRTGVQVVFASSLSAGRTAPAVRGTYTARQALDQLLAGSGLAARPADGGKTFVVEQAGQAAPSAAPGAAASLDEVKVTAAAEVSATTEGLPEYAARTTTLGLMEQAPREIPNSVSVVTRQRIEDQNFLRVEDAMQYTTALKVTTYGTGRFTVESRGYGIDRYQIDGVSSSVQTGDNDFALAMFDRVEVWRGPAGLLQGAGDPGGTVNFVRKRAQPVFGFNARASAGSWNHYYTEADITGPLDAEGRLRGRLVAAYEDRHYVTDHVFTRQPLGYGTLEYDFTPNTTLSVGHSAQHALRRPFWGYAAYADGGYPDLDRSTYIGALWNRSSQLMRRSFAELEHRLEGGGRAVLTANYLDSNENTTLGFGNSYVDRATGDMTVSPYFYLRHQSETNLQGMLTLPVQWRGFKQEFVVGASHQRRTSRDAYNGSTWGDNGFLLNVFAPNPDVPRPDVTIDPAYANNDLRQSAVFGQARIRISQPLVLLAGARVTWYESRDLIDRANDSRENAKAVPYAGAVYELSPTWSAYGSYSAIFNPQTSRNRSGAYLQPRAGHQVEVGIKGEHLDGKLASSVGIYRIEDVNRAITDPDFPEASIAAGKVRSQGLEAELTGRLSPRWNLTAGYGYNTTRVLRSSPDQEGKPFTTVFPRHSFSLWTDYRFDGGWSLGAGARVRSAIFNNIDGAHWGQGSVTLLSLQAGYQITPKTRVTVTVNNLLDRKYLDRPDGWTRQSYYGEPRSVMATLSYKY
ncbi:TonB-dependent siderophore receptor [Acidovorax sp. LjRoot194]|uniref:TonB-dependent siderophore receptor n=1 Tax=Acidovorax sp. LjRoot194 TaxID=3342280 RepID=UPI003ECF9A9C